MFYLQITRLYNANGFFISNVTKTALSVTHRLCVS